MIQNIKNNYVILDYLLDLSTYYTSLSVKNLNKMMNLKQDKRYKENSFKRDKKLEGLKQYSAYLDEKLKNINNMIDKINNNEIKNVSINFL